MRTNWALIKRAMIAAIDLCERLEKVGDLTEAGSIIVSKATTEVRLGDVVRSAWTYPEAIKYKIIKSRDEDNQPRSFVPDTAKILLNMAAASAELVGVEDDSELLVDLEKMLQWYTGHAAQLIDKAVAAADSANNGRTH